MLHHTHVTKGEPCSRWLSHTAQLRKLWPLDFMQGTVLISASIHVFLKRRVVCICFLFLSVCVHAHTHACYVTLSLSFFVLISHLRAKSSELLTGHSCQSQIIKFCSISNVDPVNHPSLSPPHLPVNCYWHWPQWLMPYLLTVCLKFSLWCQSWSLTLSPILREALVQIQPQPSWVQPWVLTPYRPFHQHKYLFFLTQVEFI